MGAGETARSLFQSVLRRGTQTEVREVRILFENKSRHNGQVQGRSSWMQSVHAFGARPGEACEVRITQAGRHSLHAELAA